MKNVIITGTSRGIGFELAQQFASAGHRVLGLSRNAEPLTQLNLKSVEGMACDLASPKATNLVKAALSQWDSVDILIHNAGFLVNKPFLETTLEDFNKTYEVNVFALAQLTQIVLPKMNKNGHVVAISSMGGIQGSAKFPGLSAYSSSKGAVITLMELLAEEFKDSGPAFNTLAIGAVQTEMLAAAFPGYQAPLQPQEMATYIMNFALTGNKFYNGKVLQVSSSTP